jgi:guanylate kinase
MRKPSLAGQQQAERAARSWIEKEAGELVKGTSENPLLIVLSGPSGVGKDAILEGIKKRGYPLHFAVTATTRPRRKKETRGVDYHFVSKAEFESMIERGELLEWANVYGNLYGVPRSELQQAMEKGEDVIVKVDVQGAATIKKTAPQAVFVFLAPPSIEDLKKRLEQRKTECDIDLQLRIKAAEQEMNSLAMFDYVVVNHKDGIGRAISQIEAIITAEKCRVKPRKIEFKSDYRRQNE